MSAQPAPETPRPAAWVAGARLEWNRESFSLFAHSAGGMEMAETEDHASHTVSRSMTNNAGPSFVDSKLSGVFFMTCALSKMLNLF